MLFCTESPETTNEKKKHEQNNKKRHKQTERFACAKLWNTFKTSEKNGSNYHAAGVSDVSWRIDEGGEDTCRSASNFFHGHYKISTSQHLGALNPLSRK